MYSSKFYFFQDFISSISWETLTIMILSIGDERSEEQQTATFTLLANSSVPSVMGNDVTISPIRIFLRPHNETTWLELST